MNLIRSGSEGTSEWMDLSVPPQVSPPFTHGWYPAVSRQAILPMDRPAERDGGIVRSGEWLSATCIDDLLRFEKGIVEKIRNRVLLPLQAGALQLFTQIPALEIENAVGQ